MANVVINDFSSQTVSQADDSFVIQEAGGTTKKLSKLLLAQSIAYAGYKSYNNITVSRPSVSTVTVSWTQLGIEGVIAGAQSLTLDITASGLLGLDTGAEALDTWYYLWIIAKIDGTVSAILSISSTAPTMPAGYTLKRYVCPVRNTSGDIVNFYQTDRFWSYITPVTLHSTTSTTLDSGTERDLAVYIPAKTYKIYGNMNGLGVKTTSGYILKVEIRGANGSGYYHRCEISADNQLAAGSYASASSAYTLITTNRKIYTYTGDSVASPTTFYFYVFCTGFEIEL